MAFRFNYGAEAVGRALPDLERAAYDQQSFAAALELQKVQRANQAMDLDNARSILQIRDTRIRRDLEQQRADQQQRAQGIAWRNQIAALGGRALPPDQQPGANDIVQVDPFTGDRFAYMQPEFKAKMEEAREEVNAILRKGGRILDAPEANSFPMQMPDGKTVHVALAPDDSEGWDKQVSRMVQFVSAQQAALVSEAAKYEAPIREDKRKLALALKAGNKDTAEALQARIAVMEQESTGVREKMKSLAEAGDFWAGKSGQPGEVPWKYTMQGLEGVPPPAGAAPAEGAPDMAPVETPRGQVYPGGITVSNSGAGGAHEVSMDGRVIATIEPAGATVTAPILVKVLDAPGARESMTPAQAQAVVAAQVLTPVQLATLTGTEYDMYVKALRVMATGQGDMAMKARAAYDRIVAQAMARTKAPAP